MPILSLLAFAILCWLSCALTARAGEPSPSPAPQHPRFWSGLVLATNGAHPGQPPEHLRPVARKLTNIFGYNQFQVIGESSQKIDDSSERWLIPSKDFYMSVRSPNGPGPKNPTHITLFQNRKRLAEMEAHIGPDSPLFIRGPQYAGGQLVIVVRVADPSEFPERPVPKAVIVPVRPAPFPPIFGATPTRIPERVIVPPPPPTGVPLEKFYPGPDDHLSPLPGEGRGDPDSKMGKP
jgi:hypothetical protein